MNTPCIPAKRRITSTENETATYFGLTVEVIVRMSSCSLIRCADREAVVDTADLQKTLVLGQAA